MNAEILQMISIVAFALAGILAVTATILFFRLNVRGIMDDLSGRTAERQIRELREQNRKPETNPGRKILYRTPKEKSTEKLVTRNERTSPLNITSFRSDEEGTTMLGSDNEGTTVLETGYRLILDEIVLHTDERI